jgi:hypothetical protein
MTASKNLVASVRQRLLNLSRERKEDFNLVLTRFGIERLLYRLSKSENASDFILKGAMLFHLWSASPHRPTRDVDLLSFGSPDLGLVTNIFRRICAIPVEPDGVVFDPDSVAAEAIREEAIYDGLRVTMMGRLGVARIPLQIDVGFGDAILPTPETTLFPTLLDLPAPELRVYRRETVIAEKFHAMVELGIANSRMKDFFDIRYFATTISFEGHDLCLAIESTFSRRKTPIPSALPTALSSEFATDMAKRTQWSAFLKKSKLDQDEVNLAEVIASIREFLGPPTEAVSKGLSFSLHWKPGGPWVAKS